MIAKMHTDKDKKVCRKYASFHGSNSNKTNRERSKHYVPPVAADYAFTPCEPMLVASVYRTTVKQVQGEIADQEVQSVTFSSDNTFTDEMTSTVDPIQISD